MKKILFFFTAFVFIATACSDDGNTTNVAGNADGTGGSMAVFALKGDYLYTVDEMNLNVFSLINQALPVKVNEVMIGSNIETLFAQDNYLYVGSRNGMYIYSLTNPEAPVQLSSVQHFTACDPVVANSTHAFVTLHSNTSCGNNVNLLEIYDTANPDAPQLVHSRTLTYPKGLGLYGHYLFVCDEVIKVFDIQDPAAPVLVNSIGKECFDVIIHGNDLFAIGDAGLYRYVLNPQDINKITFKSQVNLQ